MKAPISRSRRLPTTRVILLTPGQRQELESIVRCGTSQYRAVVRARLVLLRADGVPVLEIARRTGVHRNHVWRWCDRYMRLGLKGLSDRPRSGRPRTLSLRTSALAS